jgi:ribosomal protein L11 methyltransferase
MTIAHEETRYPYLAVDVREDDAEEAAARLFELGATGVEQRDRSTLARCTAGEVTLLASFDREADAQVAAGGVPAEWSPRVDEIVGDAWRDEWKKHFEPFRIAGTIVIAPPWRPYTAAPDETVIVLEPGRAFGTGLHETTRLVAQALVDRAPSLRGLPVLDVGCGSGILSLLALALGAASARAIDVDAEAVLVAQENALRNGFGARLSAEATAIETVTERYPTVVANIEAQTLAELAPALVERVAPGGLLVVSGILAPQVTPGQVESVRRAYAGLTEETLLASGEWVAIVLRG